MKQAAINYGQALYDSQISPDAVETTREIYAGCEELSKILESPLVSYEEKMRIIEKVFPSEIQDFLKVVCYYNKAKYLGEIFKQYEILQKEAQSILTATLHYVIPPSEKYMEQMKEFLREKYEKKQVELALVQDAQLLGGFLLQVGNIQYDCSTKGAITRLTQKLVRR